MTITSRTLSGLEHSKCKVNIDRVNWIKKKTLENEMN